MSKKKTIRVYMMRNGKLKCGLYTTIEGYPDKLIREIRTNKIIKGRHFILATAPGKNNFTIESVLINKSIIPSEIVAKVIEWPIDGFIGYKP